ncbi:hypothetical protein AURDEDRAFT_185314 [Auricularia subglabra TFB-10046 SS5]|nr:hypothetical protein AURDEDRAFT_185314 [Auricularia subglabra TFB-10046 SS5]
MYRYPSSPPSSPPSMCSSLAWSREPSPMPLTETSTLQHPFAATSHSAGKRPPLYDASSRKRARLPVTPPETPPKDTDVDMRDSFEQSPAPRSSGSDGEPEFQFSDEDDELARDMREFNQRQEQGKLWADTVSAAIDEVKQNIDLSCVSGNMNPDLCVEDTLRRQELLYVDKCIGDLGDMVVLRAHPDFSRVDSAATVTLPFGRVSSQPRVFSRTTTQAHTGALTIRLAHNHIQSLPPEFFKLRQLVVLSLDSNGMEVLPAAIGQLSSLRELNIARNLFTTLPAELDHLQLTNFTLFPNNRLLKQLPPVMREWPTLKELCLRMLRGAGSEDWDQEPVDAHGMPLAPHLAQYLRPTDATKCAKLNACAAHGNSFIVPGHTRVEFRSTLAGQSLSERVPVLFRGCVPGCLDEAMLQVDFSSTPAPMALNDQDDEFMEGFGEPVIQV